MGGDIKNLRARIKSVDSTLHRQALWDLSHRSKYAARARRCRTAGSTPPLSKILCKLASSPECRRTPYMTPRDGAPETVIVIAGDRGLAGGYNTNAFRVCDALLAEINARGAENRVIPIGKRACDRYSDSAGSANEKGDGGNDAACESFASSEHITYAEVRALSERICEEFTSGECSRLWVVSTSFCFNDEAGGVHRIAASSVSRPCREARRLCSTSRTALPC